jgi:hypothetical protein
MATVHQVNSGGAFTASISKDRTKSTQKTFPSKTIDSTPLQSVRKPLGSISSNVPSNITSAKQAEKTSKLLADSDIVKQKIKPNETIRPTPAATVYEDEFDDIEYMPPPCQWMDSDDEGDDRMRSILSDLFQVFSRPFPDQSDLSSLSEDDNEMDGSLIDITDI